MKRAVLYILVTVFVLILVQPGMAQGHRDKKKLNWGASIGLNLSNATGDWTDIVGYDRSLDTGFSLAVFGAVNMTNHLAVRSELHFNRKGFVLTGDETQAAQELNPFGYYLDVPILLEWDFLPYKYVRPVIVAGPSFGYLMSSGIGIDIPGKKNAQARDITNLNDVDMSLVLGVRISFPAGRNDRGYFEVRYSQSMNSFIQDTDVTTLLINEDATAVTMGGPGSPDAKHQVVTISLGMVLD